MAKRSKKNTKHVYTTTKIEESKAIWRVSYMALFLAMVVIQAATTVTFPETCYILVLGAILGVDIPALVRKFIKRT